MESIQSATCDSDGSGCRPALGENFREPASSQFEYDLSTVVGDKLQPPCDCDGLALSVSDPGNQSSQCVGVMPTGTAGPSTTASESIASDYSQQYFFDLLNDVPPVDFQDNHHWATPYGQGQTSLLTPIVNTHAETQFHSPLPPTPLPEPPFQPPSQPPSQPPPSRRPRPRPCLHRLCAVYEAASQTPEFRPACIDCGVQGLKPVLLAFDPTSKYSFAKEKLVIECGIPRIPIPTPRRLEKSPGQFVLATHYINLNIRMADKSAGILDTDDLTVAIEPSNGVEEDDGSHTLVLLGENALNRLVRACFEAGA